LNIFALAAENDDALFARWQRVLAELQGAARKNADDFRCAVKADGRVSINMTSSKLLGFIDRGRHVSPHELATELAHRTGASAADEFRRLQGRWFARRACFDGTFDEGRQFLYGALNAGGLGLDYYGGVCVVFSAQAFSDWRVAFTPGNSLELYTPDSANPTLEIVRLKNDLGSEIHRHTVAGLKHAHEDLSDRTTWSRLLCDGKDRFVEVIFVGNANHALVQEIRVDGAVFEAAYIELTTARPIASETRQEARAIALALEGLPAGLSDLVTVTS
jgi:hypothetical protein